MTTWLRDQSNGCRRDWFWIFDLFWNLLREALQRAFNFAVLGRFYHDIGIKDFSEKFVSDYYHSHNYFHSRKKRFFNYMMQFRLLATRGLLDTRSLNVREGTDFKIKIYHGKRLNILMLKCDLKNTHRGVTCVFKC